MCCQKIIPLLFFLMTTKFLAAAAMRIHTKCRGGLYPRSSVKRFPVPDEKVSWSVPYPEYDPSNYTSPGIYGKPWADLDIGDPSFHPKWNELDGEINRVSHMGSYDILCNYPLNPIGRTGIQGRGVLGRWGPNHAADPVVTRWKRLQNNEVAHDENGRPILQFVAIKRNDTGEWALPGGMVDPGEKVAATALREFQEEATNSLVMTQDEKLSWKQSFEDFFSRGDIVYSGYVDDVRNTDNAWMETVAYNFHDNDGSVVGNLKLHAGDDAVGVRWVDVNDDLIKLYGSHEDIIRKTINFRFASNKI